MKDLVLIKLGGSLITDKLRAEQPRLDVMRRLGVEIAAALPRLGEQVILGHGSGSFGHVAASRHGVGRGPLGRGETFGASETGQVARQLHAMVNASLLAAALSPFSWSPSSGMLCRAGRPVSAELGPLLAALDFGMLPVVYGDVVMDRDWGAAICSTEGVFRYLVGRLKRRGWVVRRVLWLGATDGIYDRAGEPVREVRSGDYARVRRMIGVTAGTDVTGGRGLRMDTARWLASRGVESWILDGTRPGVLEAALLRTAPSGTRFPAIED